MKWIPPTYTLDDVRFGTDAPTFEKAVALYEGGKVTKFNWSMHGYSAVVRGGSPYEVYVSAKDYDRGNCTCYLGQEDVLCKHMIAVALYALLGGRRLTKEEQEPAASQPTSSGRPGTLSREESKEIKARMTSDLHYIKAYSGPSRTWFANQHSLEEGCARLMKLVSELPVGIESATLLVDLLLRLDRKLQQGGVDDSNGIVGGFMEGIVEVLKDYAALDSSCAQAFAKLKGVET